MDIQGRERKCKTDDKTWIEQCQGLSVSTLSLAVISPSTHENAEESISQDRTFRIELYVSFFIDQLAGKL
jgi:hypothetical protein